MGSHEKRQQEAYLRGALRSFSSTSLTYTLFLAKCLGLIHLTHRDTVDTPRQMMDGADRRRLGAVLPITCTRDLTMKELIASRTMDLDALFSISAD